MGVQRGGLLGHLAPSKELDDLMFEYVDEHLAEDVNEITDAVGMIKFDYFLKLYKTAIVWNRVKFAESKKEMLQKRRAALKENDMQTWRQLFSNIAEADEACLQDVLEDILDRIGISETQFKEALNLHTIDEEKTKKIQEVLEDANIDR